MTRSDVVSQRAARGGGDAGGLPRGGRGSDYAVLSREVKRAGLLARRPGCHSVKIAGGTCSCWPPAGWRVRADRVVVVAVAGSGVPGGDVQPDSIPRA
jgi:hypothetical protein